jgi:hypothetical protein
LPEGLTSIGYGAFSQNKLLNIRIPESVTTIGASAFYGNNLVGVWLPENITIGAGAFPFILDEVYAWAGRKKGNYNWVNLVNGKLVNGQWDYNGRSLLAPAVLRSMRSDTRSGFSTVGWSSVSVSKIDGKAPSKTEGNVYLMPGSYDVTVYYNIVYEGYNDAAIRLSGKNPPRINGEKNLGNIKLNEGDIYTFGCSSTLDEASFNIRYDIWFVRAR